MRLAFEVARLLASPRRCAPRALWALLFRQEPGVLHQGGVETQGIWSSYEGQADRSVRTHLRGELFAAKDVALASRQFVFGFPGLPRRVSRGRPKPCALMRHALLNPTSPNLVPVPDARYARTGLCVQGSYPAPWDRDPHALEFGLAVARRRADRALWLHLRRSGNDEPRGFFEGKRSVHRQKQKHEEASPTPSLLHASKQARSWRKSEFVLCSGGL